MNDHLSATPALPDATLAAYRAAIYRIDGPPSIDMTIGAKSADAAALLARYGATSGVFVTAFNPFGRELGAEDNAARHAALKAHIARAGLTALPGAGVDPKHIWSAETSLFVPGASDETADEWLIAFEQNAVVLVDADGIPHLRLHPRYR
ncbi:DUF3293 domain-containing protein [Caballeronia sp. Lep1P3]|uniref:DUF3293 domain-containing protein n=1 Tax=Caballeronia sp. Lep1P3 TaxID=2878150 RepID=UPI001FD246F1|nr:DUF3293 domain-containing protein [Caballeronia sp. Lep1P3]